MEKRQKKWNKHQKTEADLQNVQKDVASSCWMGKRQWEKVLIFNWIRQGKNEIMFRDKN